MINKEKYAEFCRQEEKIPLFSHPWWLDLVCGNKNWEVILVEKQNQIIASFPYYIKLERNLRFKNITMPTLTQKLGPYIKYPTNQKFSSKLSYEKKIMQEIIEKLPQFDSFTVHFDYLYTNWLPFYWKDFKQTSRYTYLINDTGNLDNIVKNFDRNKKRNLKKGREAVTILYDLSPEDFTQYYEVCLQKKGEKLAYSDILLRQLIQESIIRNQGRIIYAIDKDKKIHGAIFFVWDQVAIYELVSAFDPDYGSSGASTLLVHDIIKDASNKNLIYDFEGSMIEGVEESFRQFGTAQVPYFQILKSNSKRHKIYQNLKELRNVFRN